MQCKFIENYGRAFKKQQKDVCAMGAQFFDIIFRCGFVEEAIAYRVDEVNTPVIKLITQ